MILSTDSTRETAREAGGYVKGVAIAIVTQNKDDERLARVRVRYPWHDNPQESHWARIAAPMAGAERGALFIPEVGDEVLVAFEREDPRFPYILGALWNGQDRPPARNDDGKNDRRVIRSRKRHHLLFDDGAKGVVELTHEKGRKIILDDDGFSVQDEKGNVVRVETASGAMTIQAKGRLTIKAADIAIEAAGALELKAGPTLTIQGSLVNIN